MHIQLNIGFSNTDMPIKVNIDETANKNIAATAKYHTVSHVLKAGKPDTAQENHMIIIINPTEKTVIRFDRYISFLPEPDIILLRIAPSLYSEPKYTTEKNIIRA